MLILLLWIRSSFISGSSDLAFRNIFWFPSHCLVSRFNSPFLCSQLRASPTLRHPSLGTVQGPLFNKRTRQVQIHSWNVVKFLISTSPGSVLWGEEGGRGRGGGRRRRCGGRGEGGRGRGKGGGEKKEKKNSTNYLLSLPLGPIPGMD